MSWAYTTEEQEAAELANKVLSLGVDGAPPPHTPAAPPNPTATPPPLMPSNQPHSNAGEEEAAPSAAEMSLFRKVLRQGIVETSLEVEVLRKADPNSPLSSVKSFEALQLGEPLLKGVYGMGFKRPSKIQETALPTLLANPPQNLIAQSQSGTGKTAAFCLALLSRVDPTMPHTQALCLSPTYELALQTADIIRGLAKYRPDITIRCAVKGEMLARGATISDHIVIGTPGKTLDWLTKLRALSLQRCRIFVLDEADVMIDTQGHQDQSIRIHKQLPRDGDGGGCQMVLFSATYTPEVMEFAEAIVPNPVVITLRRSEETLANIRQMYVECSNAAQKYEAIRNIYTVPVGQSMFFCRTRASARDLTDRMTRDGHHVALLSGEQTAQERLNVLTRYRAGSERVLICTNVMARGIDVEQVTLVVNYDLPETPEGRADVQTYLHRIGRTGRFGKLGNAINIVDGPRALGLLREIEGHFNITIEKLDYTNFDEIEKLGDD